MDSQPGINIRMRMILVNWLIEVHNKHKLMPETLYLTINIVDRYLSMKIVPRQELQLVSISSMLIACKYEEIWPPQVNQLVCLSDYTFTREGYLSWRNQFWGSYEWSLTVPTPYAFLFRYIKASVLPDQQMENMVFFLAELGLLHYSIVISNCSSMIVAAAVYGARCILNKTPFWTETLKYHTGYSEKQLTDCAKRLVSLHLASAESKFKAVYKKYLDQDRGVVASFTPAKSSLAISPCSHDFETWVFSNA